MCVFSARQWGIGLGTLRAEYIQRYNGLLDRERQPHADFFINLSLEVEDELDFAEDEPVNLMEYDQYFEWDEEEYMRLRFMAARHYASRGHWDDAYAYMLRSRPGDTSQYQETYDRNSEAWHCTNVRINELIQEAEQVLESREGQVTQWSQLRPPRDSLIPLGHSTRSPSLVRSEGGDCQGQQRPPGTTPTEGTTKGRGGNFFLIHLSHQIDSHKKKKEIQPLMWLNK